ncbi:MAG: hypothetical protein ACYDC2_00765 [Solirubrobacteraceae bacterium]
MPSAAETRGQVQQEEQARKRLAVPAFAGGFLYLLSAIIISSTLSGAPTVGLLQGLAPALRGEANPAESPRAAEVKFISHHAFGLIAGSTLAAIAVAILTLILLTTLNATVFRRPATWRAARPLALAGGIAVAIASIVHQLVAAIETHNFATGHLLTNHAVEEALTKSTPNLIVAYISLLAGLALAAGMIGVMINALRVGLLPRWMGLLGMFTALLIFLPIGGAELQLVPAFWLVMMGVLFAGKWPGGDPPAWAAGAARPWPSRAQLAAERAGAGKGAPGRRAPGSGAKDAAGEDRAKASADSPVPAPAPVPQAGTSRKRRKRSGRN